MIQSSRLFFRLLEALLLKRHYYAQHDIREGITYLTIPKVLPFRTT